MFLSKIKKLALRFTIVGILALGLVVMPMNPAEKKAYAVISCEQCDINYTNCSNGCVDQPSGCQSFCERIYARCLANCQ